MMKTLRPLPALALVLGMIGCSGSGNPLAPGPVKDPNPSPAPAPNRPPSFVQVGLTQNAYRSARLTANVSDADGQVSKLVVNWGDGTEETITSGFANVSRTHEYDRAQSYSVGLTAADNQGATAESAKSVSISVPPEKCAGIKIIDICGEVTPSFNRINISVKSIDTVISSFTLHDGTPSLTVPVGVFGKVTGTHNFKTGRLRLQGDVCLLLLICTGAFDETIQF